MTITFILEQSSNSDALHSPKQHASAHCFVWIVNMHVHQVRRMLPRNGYRVSKPIERDA
jgi:hypothetical protein